MIRIYRPGDADATYAIYRDAARNAQPHYTPAEGLAWAPSDTTEDWWHPRLSAGTTFVADRQDRATGFITLAAAHLDMFFVLPSLRGTGLAGRLYDRMVDHAVDRGQSGLTTYASLFARPFLERRGWIVVEEERVRRNGQTLLRYAMAGTIGSASSSHVA